jgi:hypothetical protein
MSRPNNTTRRALMHFALVAAACAAAATVWAQGRPETGLLLDARTWQEEVVTGSTGAWPAEGWYRIVPGERRVEVRAVKPTDPPTLAAADALYFRQPGVELRAGQRPGYRYPEVLQNPRMGVDHELSLAGKRFSLRAAYVEEGIEYAIGYAGETYRYVLGAPGAERTVIRAVADIDADGRPDFLVDVDEAVYLLLSTQARPGLNPPTAQYMEEHGC